MMRVHLIYIIFIVTALLLGTFIGSVYQSRTTSDSLASKDSIIIALQNEIAKKNVPGALASAPTVTPPSVTHEYASNSSVFTEVSLFAQGARFCRGTMMPLSWRADTTRADQVRVTLDASLPLSPLADVPVSWNETGEKGYGTVEWVVGIGSFGMDQRVSLPDGETYRIRYEALKGGRVIETKDSGLFGIQTCEG